MDNRNLHGFAFFTLIIISTVLVKFAFFTAKPILQSPNVYVETAAGTKTHCFPQFTKPASAPVDIATLNLENRILDLNLDLNRQLNFEPRNGFAVTLHFFTKAQAEKRELAAETMWIDSSRLDNAANIANVRLTCSYQWLSRLKQSQNLYVVAKVAPTSAEASKLAVNYNEIEATPVLLIAGNN